MTKQLAPALLLALALPLAACQKTPEPPTPPEPPAAPDAGAQTALGRTVEKAINEAREELRTENISISDGPHIRINGREIRRATDQPQSGRRSFSQGHRPWWGARFSRASPEGA